MLSYKTSKGTRVEIELEGRAVSFLKVNGITVVENKVNGKTVYISSLDNTIVLNDSRAYKKLGAKSIIQISASDELMKEYKEAVQKEINEGNAKHEKMMNTTKKNLEKNNISNEQFELSFESHMNNKNNF